MAKEHSRRTNCIKCSCFIFWILTGIICILATEVIQSYTCTHEDSVTRNGFIILPIVGSFSVFCAGMSLFPQMGKRFCLKVVCSIIWVSIAVPCIAISCVLVSRKCNNHIAIIILIAIGIVSKLIAGLVTGSWVNKGNSCRGGGKKRSGDKSKIIE